MSTLKAATHAAETTQPFASWPLERLGEALDALARRSGIISGNASVPASIGLEAVDDHGLARWIESAAEAMGVDVEESESVYPEIAGMLRRCGPALIHIPGEGERRFLAVIGARGRRVRLLDPERGEITVRVETVRARLCEGYESLVSEHVDHMLEAAGVTLRKRPKARIGLMNQQLRKTRIGGCWLLRMPAGAPLWKQARQGRLLGDVGTLLSGHTLAYLISLAAWGLIGYGALQGRMEQGWIMAWALMVLTLVPLRMLETWAQGRVSIGLGTALKQRLLQGTLRLEPEEIRNLGAGQLLGRVIEAEAVEGLAMSAGFAGALALVDLVVTGFVLASGAGGGLHLALFGGWLVLTALMSWVLYRRRRHWTSERLELTHDLVERMTGHRTRLAQEDRAHWHDGEDERVQRYYEASAALDRSSAWMQSFLVRGWVVVGLLGLAPAFIEGTSPASLAIGLGGMMLALGTLSKVAGGLGDFFAFTIAWEQIGFLYRAASRTLAPTAPAFAPALASRQSKAEAEPVATGSDTVLEAHDLHFRFRPHGKAVIDGCSITIRRGDRILLEGASGSGKSTLASLLSGLRKPESGMLLMRGLDRRTVGDEAWRRLVASAPQFHENHILTGSLAFNLLMGRHWPAYDEDIREATMVCRELGLGELLDKMPSGILQPVGETGWQLSHGERSRIFIARALLQNADLVILDESFAALDPKSLRRAVDCVLKRAKTVLVIAHP